MSVPPESFATEAFHTTTIRQNVAIAAASAFALFWAAILWPWVHGPDDARGMQLGGWVIVAALSLIAFLLRFYPSVGRWFALGIATLVLLFVGVAIPVALSTLPDPPGYRELDSRGLVEAGVPLLLSLVLVATCLKPFNVSFHSGTSDA